MSGVALVRYLLANNAALIAVVPAARIMAGVLPLDSTLPAISINESSGYEYISVAMDSTKILNTEDVHVRVLAKTYASQKNILSLVRKALPNINGNVNGIEADSILPGPAGPDEYDADNNIYMQDKRFIVRFAKLRN